MPVDPSQFFGPTLYPGSGWLRVAMIAGIPAIIDSWQVDVVNDFRYENWAIPVVAGPKEKTLHARGTTEVSFDLRGDLTVEGAGLVGFLDPNTRGLLFPITVQQFGIVDSLTNCVFEHFSLTGDPGVAVKFQLRGRCLSFPTSGAGFVFSSYQHLVPSWGTGNPLLASWSISHSVSLMPAWWNDQNVLPTYYRFGDSEYDANITTVNAIIDYDNVYLGIGAVQLTGMVASRGVVSSQRDVRTYPIRVTNVDVSANPLASGAFVTTNPASFQGAPDGV